MDNYPSNYPYQQPYGNVIDVPKEGTASLLAKVLGITSLGFLLTAIGVATAPPAVITINCQSEPQPTSGCVPPFNNSTSTSAGTIALAAAPRTDCANGKPRKIKSRRK